MIPWCSGAVTFLETTKKDGDSFGNIYNPDSCLGAIRRFPVAGNAESPPCSILHQWNSALPTLVAVPLVTRPVLIHSNPSTSKAILQVLDPNQFYILLGNTRLTSLQTVGQSQNYHAGMNWHSLREHHLSGVISDPPHSLSGTIPSLLKLISSL